MNLSTYVDEYLVDAAKIIHGLDKQAIIKAIEILITLKKKGGRLFFLGVGGGAGNASHAVNDFRKIVGIESYSPSDNVSELTARINDDGWDSSYARWLEVSKLGENDVVLVFSVGGGDVGKKISNNLVESLKLAKKRRSKIIGVVGRDGGYTAEVADAVVLVPIVSPHSITPHTESFQAVVWHLFVSHPALLENQMKWESTGR